MKDYKHAFDSLFKEINKVVVGQDEVLKQILICILCDSNALLEGFPGLAKTLAVKTLSQLMDLKFSRIQSTPDLMPSDITGTYIIEEKGGKREFKFQEGPVFSNIVLTDEINRATPKTQSALLEAMQEKQVSAGNTTFDLDRPFFVLATQNPIEQEGT
ncbi:MAG: AAA family ATPase, partial [Nanoarchaeota archaeon]|nr:AAA family ATPase [Nanoarchaeota archaeon]